jgi:hypothetical protein
MPFDAVLVASRVMTALECKTSDAAKQLLVDTGIILYYIIIILLNYYYYIKLDN